MSTHNIRPTHPTQHTHHTHTQHTSAPAEQNVGLISPSATLIVERSHPVGVWGGVETASSLRHEKRERVSEGVRERVSERERKRERERESQ
jgi:hypothetical protein